MEWDASVGFAKFNRIKLDLKRKMALTFAILCSNSITSIICSMLAFRSAPSSSPISPMYFRYAFNICNTGIPNSCLLVLQDGLQLYDLACNYARSQLLAYTLEQSKLGLVTLSAISLIIFFKFTLQL